MACRPDMGSGYDVHIYRQTAYRRCMRILFVGAAYCAFGCINVPRKVCKETPPADSYCWDASESSEHSQRQNADKGV